ncbi:putative core protein [Alphaentomopoxvirus acuprea]|uniref:Putative core protein n=1 Tax=Alphaentomopoxvirus acuprea TaxID=62099 RepID=W6JIS7_9POXV|nr:putative core protein [Anomala cuprea entomopoxvirus]BAO49468.1 putative core protein [Anomala cuprea entomopoxvirus]
MNNKIRRLTNKNLKMPESGINFLLLIFLNKINNMIYFINPLNYDTNSNTPIVEYLDTDEDTRGKITFLPISYLEQFYNKNAGEILIEFNNNLDKKKFLLDYLKYYLKNNNIDIHKFLINTKYKDIPLIYLRKSYIKSDFSKTNDFSRYITIQDDIVPALSKIPGYNDKNLIYPSQDHDRAAWLSSADIHNVIYPLTLIYTDYMYFNLVLFRKTDPDIAIVSSSMLTSNLPLKLKIFIESDKRFFMFPMIYNEHFTCCIIDKEFVMKNNKIGKIVYFFNSSGYIPEFIKLNTKFMFIESDMSVKHHNKKGYYNTKTHYYYNNIEVLVHYLDKYLDINYFVFNTFEIQYDSPDCGMFTILFLYYTVYFNVKTFFDFKKLYYSIGYIGDLLASSYRGVFFVTKYDINNILEYKKTLDIINIKNKKFLEIKDMMQKNTNRILKISSKIKDELTIS